jgi:hypothetical protein
MSAQLRLFLTSGENFPGGIILPSSITPTPFAELGVNVSMVVRAAVNDFIQVTTNNPNVAAIPLNPGGCQLSATWLHA